jgi:hypothetical protein
MSTYLGVFGTICIIGGGYIYSLAAKYSTALQNIAE